MNVETHKSHRSRIISLLIFIFSICALIGANSYKDFFFEMKAKISREGISYQTLAEFCGWTGPARPGESSSERGVRAAWNMGSAMVGMSVIAFLAFGLVAGVIFLIFYLTGAFR